MSNVSTTFEVEGMSCNHCVNSIKNAVSQLEGVVNVEVDLEAKRVTVEYTDGLVNLQTIREIIEEQGYDVK